MNSTPVTDWFDRQAGRIFILPTVLIILAFSIFPLIISVYLSLTRFQLVGGGYDLKFIGILNYKKLFQGSQQFHFLGTEAPVPIIGWAILALVLAALFWAFLRHGARTTAPAVVAVAMLGGSVLVAGALTPFGPLSVICRAVWGAVDSSQWWIPLLMLPVVSVVLWGLLTRALGLKVSVMGFIGRMLSAVVALMLTLTLVSTIGSGGQLGSMLTTVFYVVGGVSVQFSIGLGLAWLCAREIRGRDFFRVVFFIPLMVTPVGIAYTFRMLADTNVGPFAPIFQFFGIGAVEWATNAWSARAVVMVGDTWQWVPFIFIVLLAGIESQPRDQVEAAELDGASGWRVFADITWPSIAPVAATVILIRVIEAFKIVDLPNVLTNGGPGISTESLTLHSFIEWRTLNLGGSAAVAYMLLFVATIACVSFFNFVVRPARGETVR